MMKMLDECINRRTVQQEIRVEAVGINNIRRLYPNRARMIQRAHQQAVDYLNAAIRNMDSLFSDTRLDNKRRLFLQDFFDIPSVSTDTVRKIKVRLQIMLDELLRPSLNPLNSSRFVVGSFQHPDQISQAFVLPKDREGKIYLTERFFDPGLEVYLPIRPRTFDAYGHNMGTVLLHEISHIGLDTLDFAYLDASRPFLDLIDTRTAQGQLRYSTLKQLQKEAFSTTTPANELFKTLDEYDHHWYDLEGEHKRRVLLLTDTRDLDAARQVFLSDADKRIDVTLDNADSLALMTSHLGRPVEYQPFE
ncbi:hypothetical protein [Pseudomonas asplenii]|uniref:hypothetical protein n=1 Tax=Pseudomonas asplenii TaxID=53407 RepID=UPI00223421A1|nr:hypothetical protein [Pseudomonas asplenii]UZE31403.1 hypothetical protein LOY63_11995 [Pseudomonas asplenii]